MSAPEDVTGPRDVLAGLDATPLPSWVRREPTWLPVSHAALAPTEVVPTERPPLGCADVRAIRHAAGLTQAELGELLGITEARVRRIESHASAPRLTRLEEDVLHLLRLAIEPMVNEGDRHRWARGLAAYARRRTPMSAVLQMISDGASWRGNSQGGSR